MIKPKLAFLQVKIKSMLREATKLDHSCLGKTLETFYPIDICVFVDKFIVRGLNTKMFLVAQIDKPTISRSTI